MSVGNISGGPGPRPPGSPKQDSQEVEKKEINISQFVTHINDPSQPVNYNFPSTENGGETQLNVAQLVEDVANAGEKIIKSNKGKEEASTSIQLEELKVQKKAPKEVPEEEKIVLRKAPSETTSEIIELISAKIGHQNVAEKERDTLLSHLEMETGIYAIPLDNHVIIIDTTPHSKWVGMVSLKAFENQEKAYFARGGFGKFYPVTLIWSESKPNGEIAFKLSRELIGPALPEELQKRLGEINKALKDPALNEEKRQTLEAEKLQIRQQKEALRKEHPEGTPKGQEAAIDLVKEFQMMSYIKSHAEDLTGLNVSCCGLVTFKNQMGYFIRRDPVDSDHFFDAEVREAFLPWGLTKVVTDKLCKGLATIHSLGIVHRDIKPANIMLSIPEDIELIPNDDASDFLTELFSKCEVGIIDYGNSELLSNLLKFSEDGTFPSPAKLVGKGTQRFVSEKLFNSIEKASDEINRLAAGVPPNERDQHPEIQKHIADIALSLKQNDKFAAGLSLCQWWTLNAPQCACFEKGELFKFTPDEEQEFYDSFDSCAFNTPIAEVDRNRGAETFQLIWKEMIEPGIDSTLIPQKNGSSS